jgi:hypothetical protein
VVGDDADCYVLLRVTAILVVRYLANVLDKWEEDVSFKHGDFALDCSSQSLQTHPSVNARLRQGQQSAVLLLVVLLEHQVPKFAPSVAIAAGLAVGSPATELLTSVVMDFGVWTAWTCIADRTPPVVLFAQPNDAFGWQSDVFVPNLKGFVVLLVDGNPEALFGQVDDFRKKLPSEPDGFAFEVVAETEVAQHLKETQVPPSVANLVNVVGSEAFLASSDARLRRFSDAEEVWDEWLHPSGSEQRALVAGDERETGQNEVVLPPKVVQKGLTQLLRRHGSIPP